VEADFEISAPKAASMHAAAGEARAILPRAPFALELIKLWRAGIGFRAGALGYHGTGLEAVRYALRYGTIPANEGSFRGTLFFYPIVKGLRSKFPGLVYLSALETLEQSRIYALRTAESACIRRALLRAVIRKQVKPRPSLRLLEELSHRLASPADEEDFKAAARQLSRFEFSYDEIENIATGAQALSQRGVLGGVVLLLHRRVLKDFEVALGDPGEGDLRIKAPQGLPLSCVAGLLPCGRRERAFFLELCKSV